MHSSLTSLHLPFRVEALTDVDVGSTTGKALKHVKHSLVLSSLDFSIAFSAGVKAALLSIGPTTEEGRARRTRGSGFVIGTGVFFGFGTGATAPSGSGYFLGRPLPRLTGRIGAVRASGPLESRIFDAGAGMAD